MAISKVERNRQRLVCVVWTESGERDGRTVISWRETYTTDKFFVCVVGNEAHTDTGYGNTFGGLTETVKMKRQQMKRLNEEHQQRSERDKRRLNRCKF